MRTLILQSFRTYDVPTWLQTCMDSVQTWAKSENWDYVCLDDSLFDFASEEIKDHCTNNIYALTDICRLAAIKHYLNEGYDRVFWADADILIFKSDRLVLPNDACHGFAYEMFLQINPDNSVTPKEGINNALMFFHRNSHILDAYLDAAYETLWKHPQGAVPRTALGPELLTSLHQTKQLNVINGTGLFTLAVMKEIAAKKRHLPEILKQLSPQPIGAANLCHFLRNATPEKHRPLFDDLYTHALNQITSGTNIF